MAREPLGVTYIVPPGQEATGIYQDASGIDVFLTDAPYLTSDGVSMQSPLPVKLAEAGAVYFDVLGNAQSAIAVLSIPDGPDDPENGVVHNGVQVVHEGIMVVHNG